MSAFLGHIHYWLYRKVRLLISREALLVNEADKDFDDLGSELYESAAAMFGTPIPANVPLEDIIDHGNIHGWLHSQIATAEVREATFIKDLVDTMADDGEKLVDEVFYKHGLHCGEQARDELQALQEQLQGESLIPGHIYKVMQNYYLNGMPCDGGDRFLEDDAQHITWIGDHRLQLENWQKAGASPQIMCQAYRNWFKGFVEGIGADAKFEADTSSNPVTYTIHF